MNDQSAGGQPLAPPAGGEDGAELTGLKAGTLSMGSALGMAVVVFSPVLTAATVGSFVGGVAGSSAWLSALAGTLLIACVGAAIVPFARRYVVSGAVYSYVGHVFGDTGKFFIGAVLAVGYAVGMMVMLGVMGLYAGSVLSSQFGLAGATSLWGQILIYAVTSVTAGFLAYRSLDASARLSIILLFLSAPVVVVVLVANLFSADFDFGSQFTFTDFSFSGFTLGMVLCATFFVGFESSAATAMETRDPVRTMPRVIILVPFIVGGLAVVATLLSVPSLGSIGEKVAAGESPISAMAHHAGLGFVGPVADFALVITAYAVVLGFMNYAPRVWATMAEDGLLPVGLSRVHSRRQTPVVAIVAVSVVSLLFLILLAYVTAATPFEVYQNLATLFPYVWVPAYVTICIGCIVLMRRTGTMTAWRVVACGIGAIGSAWLYINSLLNPTGTTLDRMTWVAPAAIAVAFVAMWLTSRISRRSSVKGNQ